MRKWTADIVLLRYVSRLSLTAMGAVRISGQLVIAPHAKALTVEPNIKSMTAARFRKVCKTSPASSPI